MTESSTLHTDAATPPDARSLTVEVADLPPDDPRFRALLALLFPDPRPGVSCACYPEAA